MKRRCSLFRHSILTLLLLTLGLTEFFPAAAIVFAQDAEDTPFNPEVCEERAETLLREEKEIYRRVQYGEEWSVLQQDQKSAMEDLVPYLVLNYHALDCRLNMVCDALEGTRLPHRPVGCSRLFSARGRWWSDDRREGETALSLLPECVILGDAENQNRETLLSEVPNASACRATVQ